MSATIRLRKTDFTTPAAATSLALQRIHGATCRAYWLKQALVAAGWTVYYSSTGLASSASDLWTSSSFQAVMLQVPNSVASTTATVDGVWSCLKSPTVDVNGDYLHICLSPSQAQWYDPAVRGPTNAMNTYGVVAYLNSGGGSTWLNGDYNGFLRIGMTLSPSATAFSGGAPFVGTNSTTAMGTLPTATGAMWTTHNLGQGGTTLSTLSQALTVVTEGNQFLVMQDAGSSYTTGYQSWWGLCSLASGGYATVECGVAANATTVSSWRGSHLVGGRTWHNAGTSPAGSTLDTATRQGGWRTGYIKRDGGSLISGGLACPEPPGWEAIADQPYFSTAASFPTPIQLQAVSCTDPTHFSLGNFSDFVLMGNKRIADLDLLKNTASQSQWYARRDIKAYLLRWDWNDDPSFRLPVIPPNSVV